MKKKVLIVEDNDLNQKLVLDLLQARGYETIATGDGLQAIEIARREKPDLIIMDIQLPNASGLEVTRWIKQDASLAHIPIIAVTAFAMKGDETEILSRGCDAYLSKPINTEQFLSTVKQHAYK